MNIKQKIDPCLFFNVILCSRNLQTFAETILFTTFLNEIAFMKIEILKWLNNAKMISSQVENQHMYFMVIFEKNPEPLLTFGVHSPNNRFFSKGNILLIMESSVNIITGKIDELYYYQFF